MDAFGDLLHSDGAGGDVLVVDGYQGGREGASERAFCGCTMYFYRLRTHLLCETTWMDGGMNE